MTRNLSSHRPSLHRLLFPLLLVAAVIGCKSQPVSKLPTISMTIGGKPYTLEVAQTESDRSTGLMSRDSMPADHGMLFIFDDEKPLNFWMRNTRFDLDIIFLDSDGRVVSVKQMKAYDETNVPSEGPAKYAIELNVHEAKVHTGELLNLPAGVGPHTK